MDLQTAQLEEVNVFDPGIHNHDSGPDFQNARIKIGELEWNGNVEIHIKSSDWRHHDHGSDQAYDNVVLHVVWENDEPTYRNDKTTIPTLELKSRLNPNLLDSYKKHLSGQSDILCKDQLSSVPRLIWIGQLDRMMVRRLEQKAERIIQIAEKTNNDWEEVAYRVLARTFGFSLNADVFERLGETLPLKVLAKHSNQPKQVEALLFGQAGFLDQPNDEYSEELKKEYDFLSSKYQLEKSVHRTHWKFGKMRPSNFPTVRLAQLSAILTSNPAIFSAIRQGNSAEEIKRILNNKVSEYWQTHYDFGKPLKRGNNQLGTSSLEIIIINAFSPMLAAYSQYTDQPNLIERATTLLEQIPAENNRYTLKWKDAGKSAKTAFDSQAMITLYKDYCNRKKCLNCTIGTSLFNK